MLIYDLFSMPLYATMLHDCFLTDFVKQTLYTDLDPPLVHHQEYEYIVWMDHY